MTKISAYSPNNSPQTTDYLLGNSAAGPATKKFLLSDLITLFLNNIPAAEGSFGFVSSGGDWSGDAYASTRAASMTALRVKVNSTFLSILAVTSRIFTASRDTYVDVLDNLDGTGTLVYTEVTNNAASPALAANSLRIAIIVTGASNIANVGSINQGQPSKVLPISSSVAYTTTDSLGNLICPRDPNRRVLCYRQITSNFAPGTTAETVVAGLLAPVIIPVGRKVKVSIHITNIAAAGGTTVISARAGTTTSGTQIFQNNTLGTASNGVDPWTVTQEFTGSQSFVATLANTLNNPTIGGASGQPASILVELE